MVCFRHRPQVSGQKVTADKARRRTVCVEMQNGSDRNLRAPVGKCVYNALYLVFLFSAVIVTVQI